MFETDLIISMIVVETFFNHFFGILHGKLHNPKIFDFRGNSLLGPIFPEKLPRLKIALCDSCTKTTLYFRILDVKLHNPKVFTDSNDVVTSCMASLTEMDCGSNFQKS